MTVLRFVFVVALVTLPASSQQNSSQLSIPQSDSIPASCPVTTRPARPFIPPPEYRRTELPKHSFFLGTNELFTVIDEPMIWHWRPQSSG
jgi:hypothetical protein